MKENRKLWFLGLALVSVIGFAAYSLKRISNFLDQFSFTPTVTSIKIENAKLFNVPPILGNARVTINIAIANPLNSNHAITDFSIRIYDTTGGAKNQIGYSIPRSEKISIPAATTTVVHDVQLLIPVASLIGQIDLDKVRNMIQTQQFKLNRSYKIAIHCSLDGLAGNAESSINL